MIRPVAFGALSCALALASSVPLTARAESREVRKAVPAHDGFVVEVENLAGTMRLEAASGTDVEVVARLHAEGSGDAETKKLLSQLDVDFESTPGRLTARARYPVDEVRTIRYPDPRRRDEDHGFLSFLNASRSTVKYQGRRVTVVSGRHGAPTLYADIVVRVPRGVEVSVRECVGLVSGGDVKGPVAVDADSADVKLRTIGGRLKIHTGSGDVEAHEVDGDGEIETGSGDVSLDGARGGVSLHTGSGDVVLKRVKGDVSLGTGSGDAQLADVEARRVHASTGSGNVVLDRVTGALDLSTGSGDIQGRGLGSVGNVSVETGSGNVTLAGDLTGAREIRLGTSSGDVELSLARPLPMHLTARTSSGDISVDLPEMRTVRRKDHELVAEVGGGGTPVSIETSSGNVRVEAR